MTEDFAATGSPGRVAAGDLQDAQRTLMSFSISRVLVRMSSVDALIRSSGSSGSVAISTSVLAAPAGAVDVEAAGCASLASDGAADVPGGGGGPLELIAMVQSAKRA